MATIPPQKEAAARARVAPPPSPNLAVRTSSHRSCEGSEFRTGSVPWQEEVAGRIGWFGATHFGLVAWLETVRTGGVLEAGQPDLPGERGQPRAVPGTRVQRGRDVPGTREARRRVARLRDRRTPVGRGGAGCHPPLIGT